MGNHLRIDTSLHANSGTYELSVNTLTLRILVSKDPAGQRGNTFARLTVSLDGNTLL